MQRKSPFRKTLGFPDLGSELTLVSQLTAILIGCTSNAQTSDTSFIGFQHLNFKTAKMKDGIKRVVR